MPGPGAVVTGTIAAVICRHGHGDDGSAIDLDVDVASEALPPQRIRVRTSVSDTAVPLSGDLVELRATGKQSEPFKVEQITARPVPDPRTTPLVLPASPPVLIDPPAPEPRAAKALVMALLGTTPPKPAPGPDVDLAREIDVLRHGRRGIGTVTEVTRSRGTRIWGVNVPVTFTLMLAFEGRAPFEYRSTLPLPNRSIPQVGDVIAVGMDESTTPPYVALNADWNVWAYVGRVLLFHRP